MIYIETETIEKAKQNMEEALKHYEAIEQDAPPLERLAAWNRFKEASGAYRAFIRANYHL